MAFRGEIPDALIRAIIEGHCIAFCGAGISMAVKRSDDRALPSWPELLIELIEHAERESVALDDARKDMISAIGQGEFLMVAQELQERLGEESVLRCLRKIFLDPALKPNDLHTELVAIPFRGFLTTNYDTLIEGACTVRSKGVIPPVLTQENLTRAPNPLRVPGTFVFKIHGDVNRGEGIVLGTHDYQDQLFRAPGLRSFLETLFTTQTVLFLGFGLGDPDIENALDRLAGIFCRTNEYHFALVEQGRFF